MLITDSKNRDLSRENSRNPWTWSKSHPDLVILIALFVFSLALHIATAARTVTYSDSGDFLMAVSTVGNCHGPGYPLFLMSAKIFSWIFPVGTLAFRVSVYSGIFASLTAGAIYWIVYRMARSRLGGVVAALAFTFSYTFWYQAVIPETYALSAFFLSLLVVLALRWERQLKEGKRRNADNTLALFALTFGLAVTNQYGVIFIFPAFLFFALDTDWREVLAVRNLLRMAAFFVIGLLPFIYEPVAAFRGPAYNYGDPSTLTRWYQQVTFFYTRGGLFSYPWSFFPARFMRYFATLTTEFPYLFWLAAVGLVGSFVKRRRKHGVFLLLLFLLSSLTVMTYAQLESVLRAHFYYTSYLLVAIWIGFGAAWLYRIAGRLVERTDRVVRLTATGLVALLVLVLVIVSVPAHYGKVDKSGYTYARDMATKMLEKASPDGVVLVDSDNVIFPCMYMQVVEGLAPGVRLIIPHTLGAPGWPSANILKIVPPPGMKVLSSDPSYLQLAKLYSGSEPFFSTGLSFSFDGWNQQWEGLLNRIYPQGARAVPSVPAVLKPEGQPLADLDSDARAAIALPDSLRAEVLTTEKNLKEAERLYQGVTAFAGKDLYVPTLYGCDTTATTFDLWAQLLNQMGNFQKTVMVTPGAKAFNPDFASLAYARALEETGQPEAALNEVDKYITGVGANEAAYVERGEILIGQKRYREAVTALRTAEGLDPADPQAHYDLGLALYGLGDVQGARKEFQITVDKGPGTEWGIQARKFLESGKAQQGVL